MRRRHEPRAVIRYQADVSCRHPNFRLFRSFRTLQGLDNLFALRGMEGIKIFDFDQHLLGKGPHPIRDWSFVDDLNRMVRTPKGIADAAQACIARLFPVPTAYQPSIDDVEAVRDRLQASHRHSHERIPTPPISDFDSDSDGDESMDSGGNSSSDDRYGPVPSDHDDDYNGFGDDDEPDITLPLTPNSDPMSDVGDLATAIPTHAQDDHGGHSADPSVISDEDTEDEEESDGNEGDDESNDDDEDDQHNGNDGDEDSDGNDGDDESDDNDGDDGSEDDGGADSDADEGFVHSPALHTPNTAAGSGSSLNNAMLIDSDGDEDDVQITGSNSIAQNIDLTTDDVEEVVKDEPEAAIEASEESEENHMDLETAVSDAKGNQHGQDDPEEESLFVGTRGTSLSPPSSEEYGSRPPERSPSEGTSSGTQASQRGSQSVSPELFVPHAPGASSPDRESPTDVVPKRSPSAEDKKLQNVDAHSASGSTSPQSSQQHTDELAGEDSAAAAMTETSNYWEAAEEASLQAEVVTDQDQADTVEEDGMSTVDDLVPEGTAPGSNWDEPMSISDDEDDAEPMDLDE